MTREELEKMSKEELIDYTIRQQRINKKYQIELKKCWLESK